MGQVEHGEGLASLGRSFETAGARAFIVGLWKVPDEQTAELMQSFYTYLAKGRGCAESLRAAKLELKRRYPQSYYRGAFICTGDWGSIAISNWQRP